MTAIEKPLLQEAAASSSAMALDEIRQLVEKDLPQISQNSFDGQKPTLAQIRDWIWFQGAPKKQGLRHPRIALFSNHSPHAQSLQEEIRAHAHPLIALTEEANADLQIYELQGRLTTDEDTARAMSYGMMAAQPGIDLLVVATLDDTKEDLTDLTHLTPSNRSDIAALCGTIIAARLAKIPVLLTGNGATTAAGLLKKLNAGALAHCRNPHDILDIAANTAPPMDAVLLIPFLKSIARLG